MQKVTSLDSHFYGNPDSQGNLKKFQKKGFYLTRHFNTVHKPSVNLPVDSITIESESKMNHDVTPMQFLGEFFPLTPEMKPTTLISALHQSTDVTPMTVSKVDIINRFFEPRNLDLDTKIVSLSTSEANMCVK